MQLSVPGRDSTCAQKDILERFRDRLVLTDRLRQERVGEDEYRQAVREFETSFLPEGILAAPLVVPLEEWRRYSQEDPFSER